MKNIMKKITAFLIPLAVLFASCSFDTDASGKVEYKVSHYLQNIDDDEYTLYETEAFTGFSGKATEVTANSYEGFTAQNFEQQEISKDLDVVIKYDRNIITCVLNYNGGTVTEEDGTVTESSAVTGRYGAPVTLPEPEREGCVIEGWYDDSGNEIGSVFTKSGTYTADWIENPDSTYTVKYLFENLEDDEFSADEAYPDKIIAGLAGNETNVKASVIPGFTVREIQQQTIAADGSTVVEIKYARKVITLYIDMVNGVGTNYITGKCCKESEAETSRAQVVAALDTLAASKNAPQKAGFTFDGFYYEENLAFTLDNDNEILITAVWKGGQKSQYVVRIYKEKADYTDETDRYTLAETLVFEGSSGNKTEAVVDTDNNSISIEEQTRSYNHFIPESVSNVEIAGNGSTVLNFYYDRQIIKLTYDLNGGNINGDCNDIVYTGRYEQTFNGFDKTAARTGYTFNSWNQTYTKFPDEDKTVTANWAANTYKVTYHMGDSSETKDYAYDTEYTVPTLSDFTSFNIDTGILAGWTYTEGSKLTDFNAGNIFKMPVAANIDLYGVVYTSYYTVKHMLQDANDDNYTEDEAARQYIEAAAGSTTAAEAGTYEHFTAQSFDQQTVAEDNSTVVEVKYDRETFTVEIDLGKGGYYRKNGEIYYSIDAVTVKYDGNFTFSYTNFQNAGYDSTSLYFKDSDGNKICDVPWTTGFTVPNVKSDLNLVLTGEALVKYNIYLKNSHQTQYDGIYRTFTVEDTEPVILLSEDKIAIDNYYYSLAGWYTDNTLQDEVDIEENGNVDLVSLIKDTYGDYRDNYSASGTYNINIYAKWHIADSSNIPTSNTAKGVGDIALSDGTFINVSDLYIDGFELTIDDATKEKAAAVISHQVTDTNGTTTWRGIGKNLFYNKFAYVSGNFNSNLFTACENSSADGYPVSEVYSGLSDSDKTYTYRGETCYYYRALEGTDKYGTNYLNGTTYSSGWYIPSKNELESIKVNIEKISLSMNVLGAEDFSSDFYGGGGVLSCTTNGSYTEFGSTGYYLWGLRYSYSDSSFEFSKYYSVDTNGWCLPCHKF